MNFYVEVLNADRTQTPYSRCFPGLRMAHQYKKSIELDGFKATVYHIQLHEVRYLED